MRGSAAKEGRLWPALVAATALLLTAPQALASRTASARPDLLASPALEQPAAAEALVTAYVPRGFELRLESDSHPRQLALFPDLTPPPTSAAGEKLASGVASWEPRPNLQRIQVVVVETWWVREHLGSVDSPNLYQAFGLDPQNNTDPYGLCLFGWSCRQVAEIGADYVASNVKSIVGYAYGAVDVASLGALSGNVERVKTFVSTEGSVQQRAAAAEEAGARQQLNAATMGFAEAPDKLEHASKLFGTAGVKSGTQKIGEGIGSGNFEQIVEGTGEFLGGTGQIAGWAALAYSPFAPKPAVPGTTKPTPPEPPSGIPNQLPTVEFDYLKHPDLADNIWQAQKAGHPDVLTRGPVGLDDFNRPAALDKVPEILSRDEYPFASTLEGGANSWVGHVPPGQNSAQGGILMNFYRRFALRPGDQFRVKVVNHPGGS